MRHVTPTMIWIFFRWDVFDGISNKCRNPEEKLDDPKTEI